MKFLIALNQSLGRNFNIFSRFRALARQNKDFKKNMVFLRKKNKSLQQDYDNLLESNKQTKLEINLSTANEEMNIYKKIELKGIVNLIPDTNKDKDWYERFSRAFKDDWLDFLAKVPRLSPFVFFVFIWNEYYNDREKKVNSLNQIKVNIVDIESQLKLYLDQIKIFSITDEKSSSQSHENFRGNISRRLNNFSEEIENISYEVKNIFVETLIGRDFPTSHKLERKKMALVKALKRQEEIIKFALELNAALEQYENINIGEIRDNCHKCIDTISEKIISKLEENVRLTLKPELRNDLLIIAYNLKGKIYRLMGDYYNALESFNKILGTTTQNDGLDPKNISVLSNRGRLLCVMYIECTNYQDKYEYLTQAGIDLSYAREKQPLQPSILTYYADYLILKADSFEENEEKNKLYKYALTLYNEAIYINPQNYQFFYERSKLNRKIYLLEKKINLGEVLSDLHQVVSLKPDYYPAYLACAEVLQDSEDSFENLFYSVLEKINENINKAKDFGASSDEIENTKTYIRKSREKQSQNRKEVAQSIAYATFGLFGVGLAVELAAKGVAVATNFVWENYLSSR